uniref:Uncharacterized protein n=1 Tax=Arundo donax TaxID=35708 RepID=A0A0A8ZIU7_ARUDO
MKAIDVSFPIINVQANLTTDSTYYHTCTMIVLLPPNIPTTNCLLPKKFS